MLVTFSNGKDWLVTTPAGLFDGSSESWGKMLWRFNNNTFDVAPVEAYFREYYYPALLPRLLSGQPLPQIRPLATLNRTQPQLKIITAKIDSRSAKTVSVLVDVSNSRSALQKDGEGRNLDSGVFDVRLFRDGQMVGQWPVVGAEEKMGRVVTAKDRKTWRRAHQVKLDISGKAAVTFHHVPLPQRLDDKKVEFTAYAFNSDRVKSVTTPPFEYAPPMGGGAAVSRRAYLITMGVNANQSHNLDLELAVSSADKFRTLMRGKLEAEHSEVVEVPLYSDLAPDSDQVRLKTARKEALKAVLDLLAGRSVAPILRNEVDPEHKLQAAGPDDAVILYVASHGYADPQGTFYLMPYDELFKRIGDLLLRLIDYQMFSILLLNPKRTKLQHRFSLRFNENVHLKHDVPLGRGLVGYAVEHNESIVVPDVTRDARYIPLNPETMSELCVPLVYKGKVIGVLDLEHTRRSYFTGEHARMVKTLAAQIAISIENARLYEKIERQEQSLENDLLLARELQYRLLPQKVPLLGKAEVAARAVPARAIGGDLYDFVRYAGTGLTAIAIGDVSGKGAPAAIYAALVNGILRSHAAEKPGAAEMLSAINLSLADRPISAQFVSIIYALWNENDETLRIANSGLPHPYRCVDRKAERVEISGLPLGLFATAEYDEVTFPAKLGDVFLFFSDGIPDAQNEAGGVFGMKRLAHVLERHCDESAGGIVDAVFAEVNRYVGSVEAFDDQTVAVLKIGAQT